MARHTSTEHSAYIAAPPYTGSLRRSGHGLVRVPGSYRIADTARVTRHPTD